MLFRELLAALCVCVATAVSTPCDPVHLPQRGPGPAGAVCRCSAASCDTIEPVGSLSNGEVIFYQTSLGNDTDRLSRHETKFSQSSGSSWQHIELNASELYQKIEGFGGALTDAATLNIQALKPELQQHIVDSYYSDSGIEYSIGRIPIAACDFSTHVYSYDDNVADYELGDLNLTNFSIAMDMVFKIPFIQRAVNASAQRGSPLKLFGSPWQPPLWMTEKNSSLNAKLKGSAGGPVHKSFAKYFSRFITEYQKQGIDIWAVTVANEPAGNTGKWQDIKLTPEEERDFIKLDLGPTLRADHPSVKVLCSLPS
jgi:glucosylceramidase